MEPYPPLVGHQIEITQEQSQDPVAVKDALVDDELERMTDEDS